MDLYKIRKELNMGIPLNNMHLKVTDYSRVSTDRVEQKSSLKNQIEFFDDMIKSNPNWTYVSGYIDDGISGTSVNKREEFMRMIDDAKKGKFDLIITKEISRFSRNTLDSIRYTRELLNYGVAVLFINDNINTALPDSELRLTIMASMAQDEIRRLSERVKFGMNRSIKNGNILGNNMLYGYKKNKENGKLIIIEEEAKVVKKIFKLYANDEYSLSKITKILNNNNIKTSQNKKWCISTISRMIKNPKYKGYYCGKKSEVVDYMTKKIKSLPKNEWIIYENKKNIPPIIDDYLWQKANDRINKRSFKFGNEYKNNKTIYQSRYTFSSKIFCKKDNHVFHRRMQCKSNNDITWMCSNYFKEGKKTCDSPNIRESELIFIFKNIFKELDINLEKIFKILINIYQSNINDNYKDKKMVKLKNDIIVMKEKLLNLYLEEKISNKEFSKMNIKYNNKIKELDNDIINIKKDNNIDELKNNIMIKLNSNETTNKIIKILLDKIIVQKINNNCLNLNIYLNYKNNCNFEYKREYLFKRGYDSCNTKRYEIKYNINIFLND